jgi:hypothetical protein
MGQVLVIALIVLTVGSLLYVAAVFIDKLDKEDTGEPYA